MKLLAIETSCDETSIAILEDGKKLLSHLISSQIKAHKKHGGVVPELASRMHTQVIHSLIDQALKEADITFSDLDACAVTQGPGLEGSLLVGVSVAKTISMVHDLPLIGVNHLLGHIYAYLIDNPCPFPCIGLIVSGGHTQLVRIHDHDSITLLGQTRDDAAGEAFDKVARYLDLGYPGGPIVEKMAKDGNPKRYPFPFPMSQFPYEFSFSGLKTAAIQLIQKEGDALDIHDFCASFQHAVIHNLTKKSIQACLDHKDTRLLVCGGVTANQAFIKHLNQECAKQSITCCAPPKILCTDNAAMIAAAAYYQTTTQEPVYVQPGLGI